jgi:hypothetical protein
VLCPVVFNAKHIRETNQAGSSKSRGLGRAKLWLMALAWPEVQESQSRSFQAKQGRHSTTV